MPSPGKKFEPRPGTLYIVATPIGNLGDISRRACEVLSGVDHILCEDTRNSGKLLKAVGINQVLASYHKYNEAEKLEWAIAQLTAGKSLALISNAGTPLVCDPGNMLVKACIADDITVEVIPGPTAYTSAMLLSGFLENGFHFAGWLPRRGREREDALHYLSTIKEPVAVYESPKRLGKTLGDFAKIQPGREAVVARELTKLHEEVRRGTCSSLADELKGVELKGECVIVLGPVADDSHFDRAKTDMVYNYFAQLKREGIPPGKAAKLAARLLGLPAGDVYRLLVIDDEVQ